MKNRYKCVVSDLDMTLLGPESKLSPDTEAVLEKLISNDVIVIPASGRPFYAFPECITSMRGIRYAITSNGVSIFDVEKKEPVWSSKIRPDTAEKLCELLDGYEVTYEGFIDGKAYAEQTYFDNPVRYGAHPKVLDYIRETRQPVPDIRRFLKENCRNLDCIDVVVRQDMKRQIFRKIEESLEGIYMTTSAPHLIEISADGSGKHSGLRKLTEILEIAMDEVVAFGDGDNDSEMLYESGLGIAVANGSRKCKAAADYITDYNDKDGVPQALRKIFSELFEDEERESK